MLASKFYNLVEKKKPVIDIMMIQILLIILCSAFMALFSYRQENKMEQKKIGIIHQPGLVLVIGEEKAKNLLSQINRINPRFASKYSYDHVCTRNSIYNTLMEDSIVKEIRRFTSGNYTERDITSSVGDEPNRYKG
jgi:hypothetical protein